MARSRNIKPGICANELIVELPYETRFLFAVLPCFADREGRMEDRPRRIKMQVFPADNLDMDVLLQDLHDAGFILRYQAEGNQYIQIVNFSKHQNPHKNEAPSTIPAPEQHSTSMVQAPEQHGSTHADSLSTDSLSTDSLKEQAPQEPETPTAPRKRGCRIPKDWQPDEDLRAWAVQERPGIDVKRVIDSFTDYWIAKTGTAATKLDWDATFRNWVRHENSGNNGATHSGRNAPVRETARDRSARKERDELARLGYPQAHDNGRVVETST